MRRIKSRTSSSIRGRPERPALDFHLQYKRNPCRCQRITVSGLTMTRADFHCGHKRISQVQNTRSRGRSFGRLMDRLHTASCWHKARFSSAKRYFGTTNTHRNHAIVFQIPLRDSPRTHQIGYFSCYDGTAANDVNPCQATRTEFLLRTERETLFLSVLLTRALCSAQNLPNRIGLRILTTDQNKTLLHFAFRT